METGFIPDFAYGAVLQMIWHPGDPKTTKFFSFDTQSVNLDRTKCRKVVSYRCPECNELRLYAP